MGIRASRSAWTCLALTLTGACANPTFDEAGVNSEALMALPGIDEPVVTAAGSARRPVEAVARPQTALDPAAITDRPDILTVDPPSGFADLIPDGSMRYIDTGYSSYDIQINVVNVGTAATSGSTTRAEIGGSIYNVTLYHYWDGTTNHDHVLPGQRGYLLVRNYPMTTRLVPCRTASVQIDLDHTLQYGDYQGNDTREVLFYETGSLCDLTWTTPINAATTGIEPSSLQASFSPDPTRGSTAKLRTSRLATHASRLDFEQRGRCDNTGDPSTCAFGNSDVTVVPGALRKPKSIPCPSPSRSF